jgi:hypothetical protein
MLSEPQTIRLFAPAAAAILETDAKAIARLLERKTAFAGLDNQPAASAMAFERRAIVATEMRGVIAPELGWTLIEDNLACGAYEWLVGDVLVRLSKTTRESRLEAVLSGLEHTGVPTPLFETVASPSGPRDEVLVRLMGNALKGATVDVVSISRNGERAFAIPLSDIAATQTKRMPDTGEQEKTSVTLPGTRRRTTETG